jgi:UDP-N-acetylglucosamine acyltransferase
VDDWVTLGGFTAVHQRVHIGAHCMTALCSVLLADLPPFVMCQGQPAQARSMNYEGLRRRGFSAARLDAVKAMHKILYREGLTLAQARVRLASLPAGHPEAADDIAMMLSFLEQSSPQHGIVR